MQHSCKRRLWALDASGVRKGTLRHCWVGDVSCISRNLRACSRSSDLLESGGVVDLKLG